MKIVPLVAGAAVYWLSRSPAEQVAWQLCPPTAAAPTLDAYGAGELGPAQVSAGVSVNMTSVVAFGLRAGAGWLAYRALAG